MRLKKETGLQPGKVVEFGEGIGKGSVVGAAASDLRQNNAVNSPKNYKSFNPGSCLLKKKEKRVRNKDQGRVCRGNGATCRASHEGPRTIESQKISCNL